MAWRENEISVTVSDNGPAKSAWNDEYSHVKHKVTVTASTSGSKLKYKVSVTVTENGAAASKSYAITIKLNIGGQQIFNKYWDYADPSNKAWNGFPTKNSSYFEDEFDIGTDYSFPINLGICSCQSGVDPSHASRLVWAEEATLTRMWWSDGGTPRKPVISQQAGNNIVSISGNLPSGGFNNPIEQATLYYTIGGVNASKTLKPEDGALYTHHIDMANYESNKSIQAEVECVYPCDGRKVSGVTSASGLYYGAPGYPGTPKLNYKKSRLTIKEPWVFTWGAAADGSNAPVKGYRIRLYSNGKSIPIWSETGKRLSVVPTTDPTDNYYDTDTTTTSITIYPMVQGYTPGDTVQLSIFAYAIVNNTTFFSGEGRQAAFSAVYPVENAGVVNVKTAEGWVEGQVYVKTSSGWQEAETVNVKTSDGWMESQ